MAETLPRIGAVNLRPVRQTDGPGLVRYFERLTPEDVRFRFFGPMRTLPPSQVEHLINVDQERQIAKVVEDPRNGDLLAVGRLVIDVAEHRAEFSISVRSDMKGRGLGRFVIRHLLQIARERDLKEVYGDILEENSNMIAFAKELGFGITRLPETAAIVRAVYTL